MVVWRIVNVIILAGLWLAAIRPPKTARETLLGMAGWAVLLASLAGAAVLLAFGARW